MINRVLSRQLPNQQRLLKFRKAEQYLQPKRNHWIDNPPQTLSYRFIGEKQDPWDWRGSVVYVGFAVACTLINTYMYWDEIKLEDPPGVYGDLSVHENKVLGIPPDDQFGYAPLKKELLETGKVNDLGNTLRNERRQVFHIAAVRHNIPNPYDI